jgi:hypothetical protein
VGGELFDVAEHVHVEPHAADKAEKSMIMIFGYLLSTVADPQSFQNVPYPASEKNYHFPNPDSEAQKAVY